MSWDYGFTEQLRLAKVKRLPPRPLSVVRCLAKQTTRLPLCSLLMAQSPMLIVRCLLSVVLHPPNQLPTKSPLSVVRSPQRTNQSSRGYQRGRANAKTTVLPATYGNLCTSVWFCKDTKKEILTLTVCPVLSCFVPFCPVLSRFWEQQTGYRPLVVL